MSKPLLNLPFVRVLTTPGLVDSEGESPLRRAIIAGLLDAGVQQRPVVSLWVRRRAGAPLEILVAGTELPGEHDALLFPLGATGQAVGAEELDEILAQFGSWQAGGGGFEPLIADIEDQSRTTEQRWSASPLDDVAAYLSHRAFAWVIRCSPVPDPQVTDELDDLRRELYRLHQSGRLSESDTVKLERGQAWFRELSRAGRGGVWDVTVAVGTPEAATSRAVAAVLCAAAEQSTSSYRVRPLDSVVAGSLDELLDAADERSGGEFPFRATTELAASLVRPPETELPGLRVVTPPIFDTTPEFQNRTAEGSPWVRSSTGFDGRREASTCGSGLSIGTPSSAAPPVGASRRLSETFWNRYPACPTPSTGW